MQGTLGLMKSHRETRPSLHITPAWSPRQEKTGGQGENPRALGCILLFMLAAQTILDRKKKKAKKKSFVLFFHLCWLLFTYPANALALESFLQYAGERGGRG